MHQLILFLSNRVDWLVPLGGGLCPSAEASADSRAPCWSLFLGCILLGVRFTKEIKRSFWCRLLRTCAVTLLIQLNDDIDNAFSIAVITAFPVNQWASMLITPRTYQLAQNTNQWDNARDQQYPARFRSFTGWQTDIADAQRAHKMLLVHQSGNVRVCEVIRFVLS